MCVQAAEVYMQDQPEGLCWVCVRVHHCRFSSGFCDVNFTRATAIGGCGDDVLRGGLLIGRLLLQMLSVCLGGGLRSSLFGLQLSLTL